VLPTLSLEMLGRMSRGEELQGITLDAAGGEFGYAYR
jgi:type VI secretion system protein VasG